MYLSTLFLDSTVSITNYQVQQSLIALGLGGFLGKGLGNSQQKLFYLPESYGDFVFSILGEELGFVGTAGILVLFIVFAVRGIKIALRQENLFSFLLAVGIVANVFFNAIIHIGITTGMLPTTGTPLPFISYGGTSLVFTMASVGVLLNISAEKEVYRDKKPKFNRGRRY